MSSHTDSFTNNQIYLSLKLNTGRGKNGTFSFWARANINAKISGKQMDEFQECQQFTAGYNLKLMGCSWSTRSKSRSGGGQMHIFSDCWEVTSRQFVEAAVSKLSGYKTISVIFNDIWQKIM